MKRLITAALLIVLGTAQAMPVPKSDTSDNANAVVQQSKIARHWLTNIEMIDNDEVAPPARVHRATSSAKRSAKKSNNKNPSQSNKKNGGPSHHTKHPALLDTSPSVFKAF